MFRLIREAATASAVIIALLGCQNSSEDLIVDEPLTDIYSHCKDGEQLDVQTIEEFRTLLRRSKWRLAAQFYDITMTEDPTGNPLKIWDGGPRAIKLSFDNDSIANVVFFKVDSVGNEIFEHTNTIKYEYIRTPMGKVAIRTIVKVPSKTYYDYLYFCNQNKLVCDHTYRDKPTLIDYDIYKPD
ncbi:MAG: hypothetical protein EAZ57_11640 [Cytophagales bacterium]|nr:MAG: hypothetical protein EAZ67_12585 [Cytophagales bacterium]TAF59301.1 MAG: hypothetical protein EAZ57_11640 [Cytophagales bacterium]